MLVNYYTKKQVLHGVAYFGHSDLTMYIKSSIKGRLKSCIIL